MRFADTLSGRKNFPGKRGSNGKRKEPVMTSPYGKKALIVFLILVTALSAIAEAAAILSDQSLFIAVLMWIPAISAFIAAGISLKEGKETVSFAKKRTMLGIRLCPIRYILLGILIPFVYLLIPYLIYWKICPECFAYTGVSFEVILKDLTLYSIVSVLISLLTAVGEEIGWRGFLFPALKEQAGLHKAIAFSTLYWCLWHFPLLIFGGYMEGTSLLYQLPAFVLCIFPVGTITSLLREKSGSTWPAAFLHAAHNAFDQAVFGVITRGDNRMYFVSETGCLTIVCTWLFAAALYYLWVRKGKKPQPAE